jgi:dsRNA-specific ribonuclease
LIQYSQKESISLEYVLIGEEQTDTKMTEFEIEVVFAGESLAIAKGSSKKKAEQLASKVALESL